MNSDKPLDLGISSDKPICRRCPRDHPDFFFGPKNTPRFFDETMWETKKILAVLALPWRFPMFYGDLWWFIWIQSWFLFAAEPPKSWHWKKSTNHPIPAMTHLPKYCPTKKKHWEFIISVPSSSSFIFHGTFFFCPQEKLHMPNHGFLLGIPFHHAKMSPKKTCPPPIHQKIYPVHVWISLQGSKNVLKVSIIFNDLHKYLINMGLSENRVYSQLYPFNRDNDH